MKKHLFPVFFSLATLISVAQAPAIKWQKSLGGSLADKANAIRQTSDGGYIIAGESGSNDGDVTGNKGGPDFWITKIDTAGVLVWQKSLGGASEDRANDIIQTSDGGYMAVGTSYSGVGGDITAVKGLYDFWVVKLTSTGTISWQKNMGGTNYEEAYAVQQTSDGGYIIVGDTKSNNFDLTGNNGNYDFWVVKIDGTGTILWQKNLGGSGIENAYAVQVTADGGYIVSGQTNSTNGDVTGNNGGKDYWVVKLSSTGTLEWQKCLGGTADEVSSSIKQTSDGGYIVGGKTTSNNGNVSGNNGAENAWLVKLNSTGAITWQKCYGGNAFDNANSVQQTNDGGYIFAGVASSNTLDVSGNHGSNDYWVVKVNSTGTIVWQKCFGGTSSETATNIQLTSDNGYVIAGRSVSSNGDLTNAKGGDDFWVVRLMGIPTQTTNTGLSDFKQEDEQFILYPNPTSGIFNLSVKDKSTSTFNLLVTDALGKVVYKESSPLGEFTCDLSAITVQGVYFLNVLNASGESLGVRKLIRD